MGLDNMYHHNEQKVLESTVRNKIMNSCLFAIRRVRKIKDSNALLCP